MFSLSYDAKIMHKYLIYSLKSSTYLSCCTAEFMAPEPEVCGKTIQEFPGILIDQLSEDQIQQINDVCIYRKLSIK